MARLLPTQTAYIFPGQGSQSVGMGQALAQAYDVARATFAEADAILGSSLSALCFGGPAETLTETQNAQPAILTTSIAAWRSLTAARPELPLPCCMAGHSLGEYSALVVAGALNFADAVRLTRARGELMAAAGRARPGSMAAILKLADEQVAALCAQAAAESGDVVQVANYNSPGQVVISGSPAGVNAAVALVKAAGGRVMPLAVSVAAHSALMAAAAEDFAARVAATPFVAPTVPVIGNVQAKPLTTADQIRVELVAQLTSPVRWTASVAAMTAAGATRFVEIGPGNVLTGLVKRIDAGVEAVSVGTPEDIAKA
ncbi:MAG: ACP S-malonyltransferase [Chloroflexi bacterium]|nr:ACP S-malonyltransferase [Chloroflexota bacterium]